MLVVLAGCVVALAVAEWMLRTWIVPIPDSRASRVHQVYTAESPDVVLGDSHLYRAFINGDRFVNLARPGSSPEALEIVAREYFRHVDPGRVIVQASPRFFNRRMQLRGPQEHDAWFALNLGLPAAPYVFEPGIAGEMEAFLDWPALERRSAVAFGRKVEDGAIVQREAAQRRARSPAELRDEADRRVRQNLPVEDFATSSAFAAYLRTLDFLAARGARLCLVETPVTPEYEAAARGHPEHGAVQAALRAEARSRGIPYVDFRDLGMELRVDDFTNADHLTTRAGGDFARRVEHACYAGAPSETARSSSTR